MRTGTDAGTEMYKMRLPANEFGANILKARRKTFKNSEMYKMRLPTNDFFKRVLQYEQGTSRTRRLISCFIFCQLALLCARIGRRLCTQAAQN